MTKLASSSRIHMTKFIIKKILGKEIRDSQPSTVTLPKFISRVV